MSDVLVDSSAWIDFFRGDSRARARLDPLLADDRAATTGMIVAEVVSGARTRRVFDELRLRLGALASLPSTLDLWDRVAEVRFALARQGTRAHLVDLAIAVVAVGERHALLTRDRDFVPIASAVGLELDVF